MDFNHNELDLFEQETEDAVDNYSDLEKAKAETVRSADERRDELSRMADVWDGIGVRVINVPPVYDHEKGRVIPAKGPRVKEWSTNPPSMATVKSSFIGRRYDAPENIAVLCGEVSGNLVVVDLDSPEANDAWEIVAGFYGLRSGLKTGRKSEPKRGHHYFRSDSPIKSTSFTHPNADGAHGLKCTHIDILSDGRCAMAPPSVHPVDNEPVVFRDPTGTLCPPPKVSSQKLTEAVNMAAVAATLGRSWNSWETAHSRITMALAGALVRGGWPQERAEALFKAARAAGMDKLSKRLDTLSDTYSRHKVGV